MNDHSPVSRSSFIDRLGDTIAVTFASRQVDFSLAFVTKQLKIDAVAKAIDKKARNPELA